MATSDETRDYLMSLKEGSPVPSKAEMEAYKPAPSFKENKDFERQGFAVHSPDYQQRKTAVRKSDGSTVTVMVGDHVPGLGSIEDIDERGNPTILPDDPSKKRYLLGRGENLTPEVAPKKPVSTLAEQMQQKLLQAQYGAPEGTALAKLQLAEALNNSTKDLSEESHDGRFIKHRLLMPDGHIEEFNQDRETGEIINVTGI